MSNIAPKIKLFSETDQDELDSKTFAHFAKLTYELAGISLIESPKNIALIDNRLRKVLRKYGLNTFSALAEQTKKIMSAELKEDLISALTTNKTEFFREIEHYNIVIPAIQSVLAKRPEAYIWSSACSTGQEPYTLAIILKEGLTPDQFNRTKILATDIDLQVLKKGSDGFYAENEMYGLSDLQKAKYFDDMAGLYSISEELKAKVHFSRLNLFDNNFGIKKNFDLIFCRNVLIYFTAEDRFKVCHKLIEKLNPGGHLILGMSEAGSVNVSPLVSIGNSTYRKPE